MSTEAKQYRSPTKKLMRFFEKSRDKWKKKCLETKRRVKLLHTKVVDLKASRQRWKKEAKQLRSDVAQLRAELDEQKPITAAQ